MPRSILKTFTQPKISPATKKRPAFVFFRYYNDGKWRLIKRQPVALDGLTAREKKMELEHLCQALLHKLDVQGWNPVKKIYYTPKVEREVDRLQKLRFSEALDFAYTKKLTEWKPKSASDYRSKIKYLKEAAEKLDFVSDPISTYKLAHFKLIMDSVSALRKLSKSGWNIYRDYLSTLVGEMVQYDIVELNYIQHIKTRVVSKTEKGKAHRAPTQDERVAIVSKIKSEYREYYRFLSLIYGCGIRPIEITRLKIRDLHKMEGLIKVPESVGKTGYREATVPDWVMELLSEMNLHKYDPNYFIFSGRANLFLPGKVQMGSNTPNNYWKKIVRDGLKLDVGQYSLKKLSGDDLVKLQRRESLSGLLSLAQSQFGHTSENQTAEYTDEHLSIQHQIIKTKMPAL